MAPSGIRGLNAWLLSSPGDIGIIGGASAFDGLALAVARCGRNKGGDEGERLQAPGTVARGGLGLPGGRLPVQLVVPEMSP